MTPEQVARLREDLARTQPGPWHVKITDDRHWAMVTNGDPDAGVIARCADDDDAELLATLLNDATALLDAAKAGLALRAAVESMVVNDAEARAVCAESDDCPCAYKDCYECGKWHNCTHTPITQLRNLLAAAHPDAGTNEGLA